MAVSMSPSQLGPEFNDFLFAPIGDDEKGRLVSVLSALARLNLDPWAEPANLARLPKEAAIRRLVSLIAKLPQGALADLDLSAASARLVALLPRLARLEIMPTEASRRAATAVMRRPASAYVMMAVIVIVFGIQYLYSDHQTVAQLSHIHTPTHSDKSVPRRIGP